MGPQEVLCRQGLEGGRAKTGTGRGRAKTGTGKGSCKDTP